MAQRLITGETQQKILLILLGGVALGLAGNPRKYFRIAKAIHREWEQIDRRQLQRSVKLLYASHLVETKEHRDGSTELVLSKAGKRIALKYNLDTLSIKPQARWDKKWRIVMFDIPESHKTLRKTINFHLNKLEFFKYQKSVFVHPFPCASEIEYIMEFYGARKYIRFIEATHLDNHLHLMRHFHLA